MFRGSKSVLVAEIGVDDDGKEYVVKESDDFFKRDYQETKHL